MKSMIERMARALCRFEGHPENIKFEGKPMWQSYVSEALAVLAVMRDPTDDMLDAATIAALSRDAGRVWETMIEAVIKEVGDWPDA